MQSCRKSDFPGAGNDINSGPETCRAARDLTNFRSSLFLILKEPPFPCFLRESWPGSDPDFLLRLQCEGFDSVYIFGDCPGIFRPVRWCSRQPWFGKFYPFINRRRFQIRLECVIHLFEIMWMSWEYTCCFSWLIITNFYFSISQQSG